MVHDLVHALPELGILVWQKDRTHTLVTCRPAHAAVIGAVEAGRRDRDRHPLLVFWIDDDGVQAQAAAARHPL
jgi:hypothetical protein